MCSEKKEEDWDENSNEEGDKWHFSCKFSL